MRLFQLTAERSGCVAQKTLVGFVGNAQQSWGTEPSKRHRQQETSGGIEHLPLDLALRVREAWQGF